MADFNAQELMVMRQLIHFAVQARGMEVAEVGVALTKKIDALQKVQQVADARTEAGKEPPKE